MEIPFQTTFGGIGMLYLSISPCVAHYLNIRAQLSEKILSQPKFINRVYILLLAGETGFQPLITIPPKLR